MDALLGEDETQAKNRLALICSNCRLVNGQAPPGTKSLEDLGRWRCQSCQAWNGKEKIQEEVVAGLVQGWEKERKAREKEVGASTDGGIDSDNRETEDDTGIVANADEGSGVDLADVSTSEGQALPKSKSKSKGKGKK
jgi:endoplasmic reticulum junction formation protein lunapark